jgi:hypothetical protein
METIFRAIDGEEFYDKDDCFNYEQELLVHKYANDIIFITYDHKRCERPLEQAIGNCRYMYLNTDKPDEYLANLLKNAGVSIRKGLFYFDYINYKWEFAEERINELKSELENFQKAIKFINECVE